MHTRLITLLVCIISLSGCSWFTTIEYVDRPVPAAPPAALYRVYPDPPPPDFLSMKELPRDQLLKIISDQYLEYLGLNRRYRDQYDSVMEWSTRMENVTIEEP